LSEAPISYPRNVHAAESISFLIPLAQLTAQSDAVAKRLLKYARGSQRVNDFSSMVKYLVSHRIAKPPESPDLFSSLPLEPTSKRPEPIPLSELTAECTTMLDAGNDTTQTSLTNAIYHLALYPRTQSRLREVLRSSLPEDVKPVASYQQLQHIPYLRAILDESFRCRVPVNFGLPRRTIEPTTIAGYLIPAGVTISAPLKALHHDSRLFSEPQTFVPERWIPDENVFPGERQNLKDYVLPFSLGGRACIGRNLAYMELSIVVAALVLSFEWSLDEEKHGDGKGLEIIERLNSNPKELWVHAREIDAL
jgi:benzoate 4-monooxygenase